MKNSTEVLNIFDKMDYFQCGFSWFGSNITHLANASGQTVRIIISGEIINFKKNLKDGIEFDKNCILSKFHLSDRNFHRLERCKQYEYMTILKNNGEMICENYEIGANKSYIILKDTIVRQKYGSDNLFEDRYGKCH